MQELGIYPTASQSMLLSDPFFEFAEISRFVSLVEVEDYLQKGSMLASMRNWSTIFFTAKYLGL